MNLFKLKYKKYCLVVWNMAIIDMKRKYKASILSWLWLFLQPALMIFMYWFSFSSGNIQQSVEYFGVKYDYFQWLCIGVLTWTYCGDIILSGPSAIKAYMWLPKNFGLPLILPPIFVNISKFLVGIACMMAAFVISMIMNGTQGRPVVSWWALEIPLIFLLMLLFMLAWSYFLSPIVAISRDVQNLILVIPLLLSWVSGVFIVPSGIGGDDVNNVVNVVLQINPFNFMIHGVRSSMMGFGDIFGTSIYNEWYSIASFFGFIIFFAAAGYLVNRSCRKFINDIL